MNSTQQELPSWDPYWRSHIDQVLGRRLAKYIARSHYYRLLEHLFDRIRLNRSRPVRVLEAGSGSGVLSIALLRQRGDQILDVTLLDKSGVGLNLARAMAETELDPERAGRLRLVRGDLFHAPFPESSFDVVFNEGVMEHFEGAQRSAAFEAIARVCQPGGHYVCIVPNRLNVPLLLRNFVSQRAGRWEYGFQREFTIFELLHLLAQSGFCIRATGGLDSVTPVRMLLHELRGGRLKDQQTEAREINPLLKRIQRFSWDAELSTRIVGALLGREIGVLAQRTPEPIR